MTYDVVTFGEVMLRLSPPNFMRFEQTHSFDAHAGGAEMNVAVACARLGLKPAYVTKLGDNSIGHFIRNKALIFQHLKRLHSNMQPLSIIY